MVGEEGGGWGGERKSEGEEESCLGANPVLISKKGANPGIEKTVTRGFCPDPWTSN